MPIRVFGFNFSIRLINVSGTVFGLSYGGVVAYNHLQDGNIAQYNSEVVATGVSFGAASIAGVALLGSNPAGWAILGVGAIGVVGYYIPKAGANWAQGLEWNDSF